MYLFLLSPYNVAAADKPDSIRRAGKYQSTFDYRYKRMWPPACDRSLATML